MASAHLTFDTPTTFWQQEPFTTNFSINNLVNNTPLRRNNLNTKVVRLATGYVGVVTATINGNDEPIADTKPRKTYEAAEKAARKLALKIAKRAV